MNSLSTLTLGLGLFFLGIQLVGDRLRQLSGPSFRRAVHRVSERPVLASLAGVGFGALMQSATAVTFILAGMARSGFVSTHSAAPVILWSNVGLTGLAFIATLNIHSFVAYFVGAAGIFSGLVRQPAWRAAAGVCLGVGLVLFGLQCMGEGAAPLHDQPWFRSLLASTVDSPAIAFGIGILAAVILQSNTGAAMLVITLAGAEAFSLEQAAMLIYGTNLGAIALRLFLSINLDRPSRRLVRFEDLFCVWSGILMTALFIVERAGVPLVMAGVVHVFPGHVKLQIALIFLLSNLLPAGVMAMGTNRVVDLLEKWMPGESFAAKAHPKYLSDTALSDPGTAMDLMIKEIGRLFGMITVRAERSQIGPDGEPEGDPAFGQLGASIEQFGSRLALKNDLNSRHAHLLHLLRAELALVRYFDETVREFNDGLYTVQRQHEAGKAAMPVADALQDLLDRGAQALETCDSRLIAELRSDTKRHGDFVKAPVAKAKALSAAPEVGELTDAFELSTWMLHRLCKVIDQFVQERGTSKAPTDASPSSEGGAGSTVDAATTYPDSEGAKDQPGQ
jgi:phosphate:Na+ symporter